MGKICNSMYNHSASYTLRTPDESQGEKAEDPDFEEICQMKPLWASVLPNNPSQQLNRRESSQFTQSGIISSFRYCSARFWLYGPAGARQRRSGETGWK